MPSISSNATAEPSSCLMVTFPVPPALIIGVEALAVQLDDQPTVLGVIAVTVATRAVGLQELGLLDRLGKPMSALYVRVMPVLERRVRATGHVIDEERLFRCGSVQAAHVIDSIIRHVGDEVVAGLADPWKYLARVAKQVGRPLVCLAAHEPVEVIETHADRPLVEWSGRAVLKGGNVVVLAEP